MFYIEIRHLLVHNSGLIDAKFVLNYSSRFTQIKEVNNKLPLNKGLAREVFVLCRSCAKTLIKSFGALV
jgi:hypothetical protein